MTELIKIQVNGDGHELAVEPGETLLAVLRGTLGLVGPKRGCDGGGCGACTVHVDGRAVYSCMTYAAGLDGCLVTTVEGLGNGTLDPVQAAFVTAGAVQCGYCTSGMIMTAKQLLAEVSDPDEEQIRHALAGNLCRCTGYQKIVDAVKLAAAGA